MSTQGRSFAWGKYSSTRPLYDPTICPNVGLFGLTSNFRMASVCGCSAWGLKGFPAPTNATLSLVSTAGVDQMPAPANRSLGCLGGWIVHVFLISRHVLASMKFIDPW